MYSSKVILATLGLMCLSGCAWASAYGVAPIAAEYGAAGAYDGGDAGAVADIAAAKASAAKINHVNWAAVNNYGYQIGVPLLVRNYGPLTNLYSALAPKRSFVGTIDAGFYKDNYGKVKFSDESAIGAIAV
ncbi:chorion protein 16 [Cochliomyia hominivorax]